jgi:hypothetical protein
MARPRQGLFTNVSFDVLARRTDTRGARTVTLPYFVTVLRGGTAGVSKRVGGHPELRRWAGTRAGPRPGRGLYRPRRGDPSADIRKRITRKRKAGDADAAVDPLAEPDVKAAVARATFEVLVGFQLTSSS